VTYERCEDCTHPWHGLPCITRIDRYDTVRGIRESHQCTCKSSYKGPVDDDELVVVD
jgi:hypothetical protein